VFLFCVCFSNNRCGQSVRARKRLTIHESPNLLAVQVNLSRSYFPSLGFHQLCVSVFRLVTLLLVLQLKRFRVGLFGKVNKDIAFPYELTLRPYVSPSQLKQDNSDKVSAHAQLEYKWMMCVGFLVLCFVFLSLRKKSATITGCMLCLFIWTCSTSVLSGNQNEHIHEDFTHFVHHFSSVTISATFATP
jgi:hypothetical protein